MPKRKGPVKFKQIPEKKTGLVPTVTIDFKTPAYLKEPILIQKTANAYYRELGGEKPTISGLAKALGFWDVRDMDEFIKEKKDSEDKTLRQTAYIIQQAKLPVDESYERKLTDTSNPSGARFYLESFGGWKTDGLTQEESLGKIKKQFIDEYNRFYEFCAAQGLKLHSDDLMAEFRKIKGIK